jgi:hypothetical protein
MAGEVGAGVLQGIGETQIGGVGGIDRRSGAPILAIGERLAIRDGEFFVLFVCYCACSAPRLPASIRSGSYWRLENVTYLIKTISNELT